MSLAIREYVPQTSLPNSILVHSFVGFYGRMNNNSAPIGQNNNFLFQSFSFSAENLTCNLYVGKILLHMCGRHKKWKMSALFNFSSLLTVILLLICTCAYLRSLWPNLLDRRKTGPMGTFWKFARVGERLSPYVAVFCIGMAFHTLFISAWKRKFKEDRTLSNCQQE